jgi:AAA domain, putative AbiEii toxin, Type IV TA system
MPEMYLRECLIENVGPIVSLDVSLSLNAVGNPKPLILVGKNGTGKTILLSYILDALAELAKKKFSDIAQGQQVGNSPYLKATSSGDTRSLSGNSIALLEFSDSSSKLCYVEKVGPISSQDFTVKLRGRFESVKDWQQDEVFYKSVVGDDKKIELLFHHGAVCFFPSSRHERPHWLNFDAVKDEPMFGHNIRMSGILGKSLVVERSAEDNLQWVMDVFLDSLVEMDVVTLPDAENVLTEQLIIRSNIPEKRMLKIGRENVEKILRSVLEDESAQLIINYRNAAHGRIAIRCGNGIIVPSLSHLSAGQSLLFNLFATIIRYSDRADLNKSVILDSIHGIVVIDEIDAHLHTDLQYEVLPKLVKLFPKVQFIITSHSPLFLLGMEREFGSDGIQILEMPTGKQITTERFEEFLKSFELYQQTQKFEQIVEENFFASSKPLVLTEGQTDVAYIKTALKLLGHTEILEQLDIDEVGKPGKEGTKGGGQTNLDSARKFLENNQSRFPRKVLLLYDCDTNKPAESVGSLSIRCVPQNDENSKIRKGSENLLPVDLFEERFYKKSNQRGDYGEEKIIEHFDKKNFCNWVCLERQDKNDFCHFELFVVPILREFLGVNC